MQAVTCQAGPAFRNCPAWYNPIMLVLVAVALVPIAYGFQPSPAIGYDVEFEFSGFIPVMGGLDGNAKVGLGFEVAGAPAGKDKNPCVSCELKAFHLTVNDTEIPLPLDKVVEWFPKNTVAMTPQGKVLKTDLPDRDIPISLPGVDVKRMPDVSFLAVEFPAEGVEVGKEWSYRKAFGAGDVAYVAKAISLDDDRVEIELKLTQSYDTLEDEAKTVVKNEKDAVARVHTDMTGTGKATFDRKLGIVRAATIEGHSIGKVVDLQTKKETERKLTITVKTILRDRKAHPWK